MVCRLISTVKWGIVLAGSRRIIDMQIRSVGIDLGKTTFHVVALNAAGKVLLRKKFTQKQLVTLTANIHLSMSGLAIFASTDRIHPRAAYGHKLFVVTQITVLGKFAGARRECFTFCVNNLLPPC
jgi:hypothetical protein